MGDVITEPIRPWPLSHDSVYVPGTDAVDALRRALVVVEKVLASDERIQFSGIRTEEMDDTGDEVAAEVTFYVPGLPDQRWLTRHRLDEILG